MPGERASGPLDALWCHNVWETLAHEAESLAKIKKTDRPERRSYSGVAHGEECRLVTSRKWWFDSTSRYLTEIADERRGNA